MSNVSGLLGLAQRSRKLKYGDEVIRAVQQKTAYLVIITVECGDNMRNKLIDKCTFYQIPYVFMEESMMNQAIGTWNRKAVAVLDQGFAQKLHACLKG